MIVGSWTDTRLKNVAEVNTRSLRSTTPPSFAFRYLDISNVNREGIISDDAIRDLEFGDAPSRARRCVSNEDVLVSSVRPNLQAIAHISDGDQLVASTGFFVVSARRNKLLPRFCYYLMLSEEAKQYFEARATGVGYPAVGDKDFGTLHFRLPSTDTQHDIARYLDNACKAIEGTIEAKQKQLKVLSALRKSIIHKAVTRGLDDSVELKDSSTKWFDDVPMHWRVDRLKDVLALKKDAIKVGPFGSHLMLSDMVEEGIKVFTQRNVIDRDLRVGEFYISTDKYREMVAFTVFPKDLLITTRGTIGRCMVVPANAEKGILHPCLMRVQTESRVLLPEYLAILIQDCTLVLRQLQMMSAMTTIDVIYSGSLKRTYLLLPPVEEQKEILAALAENAQEIDEIRSCIQKQIQTLSGYRKSLIHECVTGKRRITEADIKKVKEHV